MRWITGLLLLVAVLLAVLWAPRWLFACVLCGAALLGQKELLAMIAPGAPGGSRLLIFLATCLLFGSLFLRHILLLPLLLTLWCFLPMLVSLFTAPAPTPETSRQAAAGALACLYVALPLAILVLVDRYPHGQTWMLFLLTAVAASDMGAFYAGRLFGAHKLAPMTSPKKTWEGAVGGVLASVIAGSLFLRATHLHPVGLESLLLTLGLSITEQIGDLCESALKRAHGVKDSGSLLPGHGGILDRIDGFLFAIPFFYAYLLYML